MGVWPVPTPGHHLIDPATGASALTPTLTSTVIAGAGARAEAWRSWHFCATR